MRLAVIGAGASGLPAIKCGVDEGLEVVCFEKSGDIGGLWRFKPNPCPDEGTVMKSTVINTSKEMTAYSDFPPPAELAPYMHNSELLKYFRSYAEHFKLLDHIRFHHAVISIERADDYERSGQWTVSYLDTSTNNSAVERFDGVAVCTGHHTEPYWPTPFPGQDTFKGRIMHSHDYKDHRGFEDKNVVIIGIGNSGADIAVELSKISRKVSLATRSGSWIMNRVWDRGEPTDLVYLNRFMFIMKKVLPWRASNFFVERKIEGRFDHGRFGLRPAHRALAAHVTINDELPNRIASGTVVIKPNIGGFEGSRTVVFEDGTKIEDVDIVIFATGYTFGFPLIEEGELIRVKENHCSLYLNMFPPELHDKNSLAVIGLIQPTGSIMPISEMQCRLFIAALVGKAKLPKANTMYKHMERTERIMAKEFIPSRRHTIQVYYPEYMDEVARLLGCHPRVYSRFLTDPRLAYKLFFDGLVPYQYRLDGYGSWKGAREAIMGMEDRTFQSTRNRKTKDTMKSTPGVWFVWRILKG